MNGRGVLVSKYIGRLIATLLPLRWRILAVSVLEDKLESIVCLSIGRYAKEMTRAHGKRACGFVISSGRNRL
jgi:hypothetical protein